MSKLQRIAEAYKMLAELGYRPAAPSDGFGGITVPYAELEVDIEAKEYARRFVAEENTNRYDAGCTAYTFNRAAVLALEAFRLMNSGRFWVLDDVDGKGPKLVPALLRKAAEEYERAVREELP
jgi:hypothetical protein